MHLPPAHEEPSAIGQPDLTLVDLLCRMQLVAMRLGCGVLLDDPSSELLELIRFAGLDDVLQAAPVPPTSTPVELPARSATGGPVSVPAGAARRRLSRRGPGTGR